MKILYEDEYGEKIKSLDSDIVPRFGELVIAGEENFEFYVKSVIWLLNHNSVIVVLTDKEKVVKDNVKDVTETKITKTNSAILARSKRQDALEKSNTLLEEQIISVKQTVRIQQGKAPKHHES